MGGYIARGLSGLPTDLTVYDVRADAMARLADSSASAEDMAAAGRYADVVGRWVRDDEQVLACVEQLCLR